MQGLITIKSIGDKDMKKTIVSTNRLMILAMMIVMTISANAMSYNAAKNEALFLSDKMAYELNLTAAQYEAVYENSWQYDKYVALSHFYRPVAWKAGSWTFAVYSHYNRGHFYNDRPTVFVTYKGGHNRIHGSHYAHMHKPAVHHHAPAVHHPAPAPHHPKAPMKVGNGRGISNHTLANNTPRHGHSRSTSGRLLP